MASKKKTPKIAQSPSSQKVVRPSSTISYNHEKPSWRLSLLELVDPFGWHNINTAQLHSIREKLQKFESMTWNEILVKSKKQHHSIDTSDICTSAKKRLEELKLDDVELLVSLRLDGRERLWGIRQENCLLLLWWDPEHKVCPSKLKNT